MVDIQSGRNGHNVTNLVVREKGDVSEPAQTHLPMGMVKIAPVWVLRVK